MSTQALFTWVHLSDLHFGHGTDRYGLNQKRVLEHLIKDLPVGVEADLERPADPVDAVFVTGDVALTGAQRDEGEYRSAARWLKQVCDALRVEAGCVYVVPGNHDVQRGKGGAAAVNVLATARAQNGSIDSALANEPSRKLLFARQAKYAALARAFGVVKNHGPCWNKELTVKRDLRIQICGLNTSLLSCDDYDQGKLEVGEKQRCFAFEGMDTRGSGIVRLLLSHHPFEGGWLRDETILRRWGLTVSNLHLCGHVHSPEASTYTAPGALPFARIIAGAAHVDEAEATRLPHRYNIGQILLADHGELRLRVFPRQYATTGMERFVADTAQCDPGQFYSEHQLGIELKATSWPRNWRPSGYAFSRPASGNELSLEDRLSEKDIDSGRIPRPPVVDRVLELLSAEQHVVITASPGAGKSGVAAWVQHELLKREEPCEYLTAADFAADSIPRPVDAMSNSLRDLPRGGVAIIDDVHMLRHRLCHPPDSSPPLT